MNDGHQYTLRSPLLCTYLHAVREIRIIDSIARRYWCAGVDNNSEYTGSVGTCRRLEIKHTSLV
jgi:hypothetical protein